MKTDGNTGGQEIDKLVEFLKGKRLVPFLGSGISQFAPSELPTGSQLRDGILEALVQRLGDRTPEANTRVNAIKGKEPNPELVYQIIYDHIGDYFFSSHDLLETHKINENHLFLARLAKRGYLRTIVTTNFDHLIENAFEKEKLNFSVYHNEKGFREYLSQGYRDSTAIIKLHGTIEDKQSVIATLRQTGKGLSLNQAQILDRLLKGQYLIFIGYSGNDFDLFPKLLSMADTAKGIYWNHRPPKSPSEPVPVQRLRTAYKNKVTALPLDLTELLNQVAGKLDIPYEPKDPPSEESQRQKLQFLNGWAGKIEEQCPPSIIGLLSQRLEEYGSAIYFWKEFLNIAEKKQDPRLFAVAYNNLGTTYRNMGYRLKAIEYHEKALKVSEKLPSIEEEVYSALGLAYYSIRQLDKAIEYYRAALEISVILDDAERIARNYNNLGLSYLHKRQWDEAIECCQISLEISSDVAVKAKAYSNLGFAYRHKRLCNEAIESFQDSLDISEILGDMHLKGQTCANLGDIFRDKAQTDKTQWNNAIDYYEKGLNALENLGDTRSITATMLMVQLNYDLGAAYDNLRQWDKAIECYQKNLGILGTLRRPIDIVEMAKTYNNLGLVYKHKGERDEAIECFRTSLIISEALENPDTTAIAHFNLGLALAEGKRLEEARDHIQEAANFYKQLDLNEDYERCRQLMTRWLSNL